MCGSRLPWTGSTPGAGPTSGVGPAPVFRHTPAGSTPAITFNDSWYYSVGGNRLGPALLPELQDLIQRGKITPETPVWQSGMPGWIPVRHSQLGTYFNLGHQPPALIGEDVNNKIVWILAFVPLIAVFVAMFLAPLTHSSVDAFWWIALPMNIGLCLWDAQLLKNAGHDTKNMGIMAVLLVPAYLFVRAARLQQRNGYAWVWIVCCLLSLGIPDVTNSASAKTQYQAMVLDGYNSQIHATAPSVECSSVELDDVGDGAFKGYIHCNDHRQRTAAVYPAGNGQVRWEVLPTGQPE